MINCIIVEDEPLAQVRLQNYIKKLPSLNLSETFDNGMDALLYLKSNEVDLMFLDINIGELSGIQLLEATGIKSGVILTTAYHEYALKAYDLKVVDYLLKPYTFERFLQAVERVEDIVKKSEPVKNKSYIFVKTEYRLEKIPFSDILYIEGMRDYRRIHTIHKKIMTLQTFKEFELQIPSNIICRVHKSFMVSVDKIEAIEKDKIKIREKIIPISEMYKKDFFKLIQ
ncbi:response regulator transcription factor [Taibaiella lutea]|uniref:Response regulator transcription factor n=1 Tax=Taibaiella lutea TaxID=2608001 RepID=A0A5M6CLP0_9BACT|nr:LytTR family DNA-binding domain-containing protein [Taibaiella lutea]KAA5536138.1 response regulator transcription factor [Taibaiella lutea]